MSMMLIVPPGRPRFYQLAAIDHWNGLYHLNSFDIFILAPYLTILTILAIYGIHRYHLVYLYLKHKNKVAVPKGKMAQLPKVTVQLPIYNELYVVDRLVEAACKIRYPRELLEIQVLDDSTDGTQEIAAAAVEKHRELGFNIHSMILHFHGKDFKVKGELARPTSFRSSVWRWQPVDCCALWSRSVREKSFQNSIL